MSEFRRRVDEARAKMEEKKILSEKSRESAAIKDRRAYDECKARVISDPRWLEMRQAARNPLLHEALREYHRHFYPESFARKLFPNRIEILERPLFEYNSSWGCNPASINDFAEIYSIEHAIKKAYIYVHGIFIKWASYDGVDKMRMEFSLEENEVRSDYEDFDSVDGLVGYIIWHIVHDRRIRCLDGNLWNK